MQGEEKKSSYNSYEGQKVALIQWPFFKLNGKKNWKDIRIHDCYAQHGNPSKNISEIQSAILS